MKSNAGKHWKWIIVTLFFGGVLLISWLSPSPNTLPEPGVKMALPDRVGDMVGGEVQGMTEAEQRLLPPHTELLRRIYGNATGDRLVTTIVLAGGAKNSIHRPEACLPAQGWNIRSAEVIPVQLANGRNLSVMKVSVQRAGSQANGQPVTWHAWYLYWFVGREATTPSHWTRLFLGSWDRVFHNVNHRWAYISIFMPIVPPRDDEATLDIMKEFIAKSVSEYMYSEMPANSR